ncbi:hypothetical protein [Kineococcus auxinigenes]|uniref:hypothetical protein n=1 Tax=unclassified Kineococcus TaxID=2621656 RepID=UPI003D7C385E
MNRTTTRTLSPLVLALALSGCGSAADGPAAATAAPAASATTTPAAPTAPATGASSTTAPTGTASAVPPAVDSAADQALADLAASRDADVVSMDPATPAQPDLAALVGDEGTGSALELFSWDGSQWTADARFDLPEPVLADRPGGAVEWRHVTQDFWSDVIVYLQGGTLHSGVDAVVASHYGGSWNLVPREPIGDEEGDLTLLANPLFDDGYVFATRASAGEQAVVDYWRFDTTQERWGLQPGPRPAGG